MLTHTPPKHPQKIFRAIRVHHFLCIAIFNVIFVFHLALGNSLLAEFFTSIYQTIFIFTLSLIGLFSLWFFVAFCLDYPDDPQKSLDFSLMVISPIIILALILPYHYLPAQTSKMPTMGPLVLIVLCQAVFYLTIKNHPTLSYLYRKVSYILFIFVFFYVLIFATISIIQFNNFQNFNSPDLGHYNQLQWNNLHGHFFRTSKSGSNFATHNSPFLIFLTPLYALYPHPSTLLILKTAFLGFSIIPFFLILKDILDDDSILPLLIAYMFYPFLVAQNFSAPHEICFAPPFLLFSYYFFQRKKFGLFMLFLILCLAIKEHMALIAVAYGLYAFIQRRSKRWVSAPLMLGILWGIFSVCLIQYFQRLYPTDDPSAWLIKELGHRFFPYKNHGLLFNLGEIAASNIGNWFQFQFVYLIFSPLLIALPFLSSAILLGMPEFFINLLSSRLIFFPIWHYHIVFSCFLLIGTAIGIKKLANLKFLWQNEINAKRAASLLSWLVAFCVLAHYFLWIDFAKIGKNSDSVKTTKMALSIIPQDASVSVPKYLAAHVSSRRDYFLLGDNRWGDYVLINDRKETAQKRFIERTTGHYVQIFNKNGTQVFRKSHR